MPATLRQVEAALRRHVEDLARPVLAQQAVGWRVYRRVRRDLRDAGGLTWRESRRAVRALKAEVRRRQRAPASTSPAAATEAAGRVVADAAVDGLVHVLGAAIEGALSG